MAVTKIIGQQVEVALSKESTRGTKETPASGEWIERGSLKITPNKEAGYIEASNGLITTRKDQRSVGFNTEIVLSVNPSRALMPKVLDAMFGSATPAVDTPEAGVDTFAYEILNTSPRLAPTYTISVIEGANQEYYAMGLLTKAVMKFNAKEIPTLELTFMAKKRATTSGLTASYPTSNSYFASTDVAIKMGEEYADLATAYALDVIETSLEFTRDFVASQYLGSDTFTDISATGWDIKAHIVKDHETLGLASGDDAEAVELFEDNTTVALGVYVVDTATTMGASTNPSFEIEIPAGKVNGYDISTELKELVGEEFDIEPIGADATNGFALAECVSDSGL